MRCRIARWLVEYDCDATRQGYAQMPSGTGCSCFGCRNFDAAVGHTFPNQFFELAHALGIDVTKPAQLYLWRRELPGLWLNGGWFHFVGSLLEGRDASQWSGNVGTLELEEYVPGLEIGLSSEIALVAKEFEGATVVQMEFRTHVPWVLNEDEPDYWTQ